MENRKKQDLPSNSLEKISNNPPKAKNSKAKNGQTSPEVRKTRI